MTKATRIMNYYIYKELLLNGNPQFESFRKDELIIFCKIAKELLQKKNEKNTNNT